MLKVFSPFITVEEAMAMQKVLASQWIGPGPKCTELELRLSELWRVQPANLILVNSCTSAIYLALRSLGVGKGDEVIVPTINFPAVSNAVIQAGAKVVLCDVNPRTLMAEPKHIQPHVRDKTRCVAVLHYGGFACDVIAIRNALPARVLILEDAAVAPVTSLCGKAAGTMGDAGVWSFDAMKILTMGSGGALWLKDELAAHRARKLVNLGMDTESGLSSAECGNPRWWEYHIDAPSGNFASNDIAAAIGLAQLDKLFEMVSKREMLWRRYDANLYGSKVETPPSFMEPNSFYTYWIQTEHRDALASYLLERNIYTTFRYYPLHRVYGIPGKFHGADEAADTTLNLPLHPGMSADDVDNVCKQIQSFFKETL